MRYLSEILVCRSVKDPVRLYISTEAKGNHAPLAEKICRIVTRQLQQKHVAYLSRYSSFAGYNIVYADDEPAKGIRVHERWHNYISRHRAETYKGEFIEEASALVIEDIATGGYHQHVGLSKDFFIPTYLLVKQSPKTEVERILNNFGRCMPEWDKNVMPGSSNWLRFIDDAKYLMLYDLCFDIAVNRGIRGARTIYRKALQTTKKRGIEAGIRYLRKQACQEISDLYNFEFDIGGYFPNYNVLAEYKLLKGGIKIEACGEYKTWVRPLESMLKAQKLI